MTSKSTSRAIRTRRQAAVMHIGAVETQVRSWLSRAMVLLWAAQALPWGLLLLWSGSDGARAPAAVVVSYVVYLVWAAAFLRWVTRRRVVGALPIVVATAVMAVCEVLVGLVLPPEAVGTWQNWTPPLATGVAVFAQVHGGYRWGLGVAVVLSAGYVAPGLRDHAFERAGPLLGATGQLVVFTIAAGLVTAKLVGTARRADAEAEDALRAREAQGRAQERLRQYDVLHTRVLTTLTLLGRAESGLPEKMRAKCARDAKFLRSLIDATADGDAPPLDATLAEVVHYEAATGLDVHYSSDGVPTELPPEVVEAVAHAVTEALNNVAKHAGTKGVWVVATGEPDGELVVTVIDHGAGFDPAASTTGTGLARSVRGRMAEVGGSVTVESHPGTGTVVEIRWPKATGAR